ncbi:DUF551 domain-containing protein [Raoultella ornithinolytica]|uniref:DUF551 domain-containing protein n=1 Tax=Raoultella ornithinolytica TaxID=54291 RepID=UPI00300FA961
MTSKLTRLTDEELAEIAFYAGESTCHPDQNYQLGFESLATGSSVLSIVRELQERRKADSEPVAEVLSNRPGNDTSTIDRALPVGTQLYRHAQPAPDGEQLAIENFRSAMEGIGHIRRTLEETFGGLHGTHVEPDVLIECKIICDAIYAAYSGSSPVIPDGKSVTASTGIQVIPDGYVMVPKESTPEILATITEAIRAMRGSAATYARVLAAAQHDATALNSLQSVDSVAGKWIPVSERAPENDGAYLCWDKRYVTTYAFIFGAWQANQFIAKNITHWMPLPAAPQEVKSES